MVLRTVRDQKSNVASLSVEADQTLQPASIPAETMSEGLDLDSCSEADAIESMEEETFHWILTDNKAHVLWVEQDTTVPHRLHGVEQTRCGIPVIQERLSQYERDVGTSSDISAVRKICGSCSKLMRFQCQ